MIAKIDFNTSSDINSSKACGNTASGFWFFNNTLIQAAGAGLNLYNSPFTNEKSFHQWLSFSQCYGSLSAMLKTPPRATANFQPVMKASRSAATAF